MLSYFVPGIPAPQGSKRAFIRRGGAAAGRIGLAEMSKRVGPWRKAVKAATEAARITRPEALGGPVRIVLEFVLQRPAKTKNPGCTGRTDLVKLVRSTLDGITMGGAIIDDAQVVQVSASKRWTRRLAGEAAGCSVSIEAVEAGL